MGESFGGRARRLGLSGLEVVRERKSVERQALMLSQDLAYVGELLVQARLRPKWDEKAGSLKICASLLNRVAAHADELAILATMLAAFPETPDEEPLQGTGTKGRRPAASTKGVRLVAPPEDASRPETS